MPQLITTVEPQSLSVKPGSWPWHAQHRQRGRGAYIERSPIVVINGGPSDKNVTDQNTTDVVYSHSMGRPHTDLDVFRNITVFSERETDINRLPQVVDDAIAAALIRKHPVYLEIPRAQLDSACPQPVGAIDVTVPAADADAVATSILQELDTVANPVVIVGEGSGEGTPRLGAGRPTL